MCVFFLMIRRPPRSTLFPYNDALPIYYAMTLEYTHIIGRLKLAYDRIGMGLKGKTHDGIQSLGTLETMWHTAHRKTFTTHIGHDTLQQTVRIHFRKISYIYKFQHNVFVCFTFSNLTIEHELPSYSIPQQPA